jgi:hypothetical protein
MQQEDTLVASLPDLVDDRLRFGLQLRRWSGGIVAEVRRVFSGEIALLGGRRPPVVIDGGG